MPQKSTSSTTTTTTSQPIRTTSITANDGISSVNIPKNKPLKFQKKFQKQIATVLDAGNGKRDRGRQNEDAQVEYLRSQLYREREQTRRLRALQIATEDKMSCRISKLEEKIANLTKNEEKLEKRRVLDAQGWRSECSCLNQRLQSIERRQRRLCAMYSARNDVDQLEIVLNRYAEVEKPSQMTTALASRSGSVSDPNDGVSFYIDLDKHGLRDCVNELSRELVTLKDTISNLEHRINSEH